jgi:hypothetical protein
MSVLLALAAAALPLDGEVYFPVRIDCDLVSARSKGKYDRTSSKLTLLFPFEAKRRGRGYEVYTLTGLDDGRSWLKIAESSSRPEVVPPAVHTPIASFIATLDLGGGDHAFLHAISSDGKRLDYESRSLLTDGAGEVTTRGECQLTRELDSK